MKKLIYSPHTIDTYFANSLTMLAIFRHVYLHLLYQIIAHILCILKRVKNNYTKTRTYTVNTYTSQADLCHFKLDVQKSDLQALLYKNPTADHITNFTDTCEERESP